MKKLLAIVLALSMLLALTACGKNTAKTKSDKKSNSSATADSSTVSEPSDLESEEQEPIMDPSDETSEEDPTEPEDPIAEEPGVKLTPMQQRAESVKDGNYQALFEKSVASSGGNSVRLANAIRKLQNGQDVTVVFFGGENTANDTYSSPTDSYPALTYQMLCAAYPKANIKMVYSGYSGLTSVNATTLLKQKVLDYNPDIILLDFSVQDAFESSTITNSIAFDAILMKLLTGSKAAVINLLLTGAENNTYTMNITSAGAITTSANLQKKICAYYGVPVVDFETAMWEFINSTIQVAQTGDKPLLNWGMFSDTNTYMNAAGCRNLAGCIMALFTKTEKNLKNIGATAPAVQAKTYYGSTRYLNTEFYSVADLIDGTAQYKFIGDSADLNNLRKNGYNYNMQKTNSSVLSAVAPSLQTYNHYISTTGTKEDKELETNPLYLEVNLPTVSANSSVNFYFQPGAPKFTVPTTPVLKNISPLLIVFYNKDGNILSQKKPTYGTIPDAMKAYRFSTVTAPSGTVKAEIKIYGYWSPIYFYGIGIIHK